MDAEKERPLAHSVRWSGFITATVGGGNLVVLLVLARLLQPADFGAPALGVAALGLVQLFLQNGLPGAVIFRQERSREALSGLFWINMVLGGLGALLLFALSRPLAVFFEEDRLADVLSVLALLPILSAAGAIYKSIQLRDLHYRQTAGAELFAFFAGSGAALYLAVSGFGYWALVGQVVAKYAAEYLWYMAAGWKQFRPALVWNREALHPHVRFAQAQIGERLTMYLNANWDTLLIGKLLGTELLGVYDVFKRLVARPTALVGEWIDRFAFPLMARVRHDRSELTALYVGNLRLLSALLAPFAWFGAVFAVPVLEQLTGAAWSEEAMAFQLLVISLSINALLHPLDGLLLAVGKIQRLAYANIVLAVVSIPAYLIGSHWGLAGVAAAQVVLAAAVQYPFFVYLMKPELKIRFSSYLRVPLREVLIGAIVLLPAYTIYIYTNQYFPAVALWIAGAVYLLIHLFVFKKRAIFNT
ncbi:MAG: oligosaccharide flippase family protein [Saprospiraceae bacterium]|nr:oligosaccharide flippase family protein [Saprospiraceae bacterium]